jgi:hypothetical protein
MFYVGSNVDPANEKGARKVVPLPNPEDESPVGGPRQMTILARTRTVATRQPRNMPAKPLPFGAGLEEPKPVRVIPASSADAPVWASSVQKMLKSLRYSFSAQDAARAWIESRGTIKACPLIDRGDWDAVDNLVAMMRRPLPRKAPATKPAPVPTVPADHRPSIAPFSPDPADRTWAEINLREVFETKPAPPFWDRLEAMGHQLRDRGDQVGKFLAAEIERLVMTASLIGSGGPDDFDSLRDLAEMTARGVWESRGYEAGYVEGLVDGAPCNGQLD